MPKLTSADASFVDVAQVVISTHVDMPATRPEIWSAVVDNSTWPDWFVGCRACDGQPTVWTDAGQTRRIHVGRLKIDEIAVELRRGERWVMSVTRTSTPMASRIVEVLDLVDTSTPAEIRTDVRWTAGLELPLMLRPLQALITGRMIDSWGSSLENLSDFVASRR